ncbi:MAG TPA: prolyl oligopeptidase family serine peptidase [Opitutaceae bacterium]
MNARTASLVLILSLMPWAGRADPSADLSRDTPVPGNQQIPVADFFRPGLLNNPRLNPSGTSIAALVHAGSDHQLLMVYDVKTQKVQVLGPHADVDVTGFTWLNDKRLAYLVASQKLYGLGLFGTEISDLGDSYPILQYYGSEIIAVPRSERPSLLVWNRMNQLQSPWVDQGVALINSSRLSRQGGVDFFANSSGELMAATVQTVLENNDLHQLKHYPTPPWGTTTGYMADKDGNLAFAFTSQNALGAMFRLENDSWVRCPVDVDRWSVHGAGNKPGEIIARSPHQEGHPSSLDVLDSATGAVRRILAEDKAYDFVGGVHRSPASGEIIGVSFDREGPHSIWFTDAYRKYQETLNASFPGLVVRILDSNEAQDFFLALAYSDRQPPLYVWVDFKKHRSGLFRQAAPWIDPKRMRPEAIIRFKTRDGKTLDAYLTLPNGASKDHPSPLIVIPHGGPWVRDSWGFDGEAQFLASRGYAVLKPNYRASPGYEWQFAGDDHWDFAKMSHDVTDATKAMVASGLVDPHRIAIMGGSFGGFLSLMGVVNEPDLYRCAVGISGVYDWAQLIRDVKYNYTVFTPWYSVLLHHLGDPGKDGARFDAIAPSRHVDRIHVPVFVTHGGNDPIADIGQSTSLIDELKKHNIPYESFIVGSEGHGMLHFTHRVDQYTRIEAFLAKNLAPTPPP